MSAVVVMVSGGGRCGSCGGYLVVEVVVMAASDSRSGVNGAN